MLLTRPGFWLLGAAVGLMFPVAAHAAPDDPVTAPNVGSDAGKLNGYRLQETDEPLTPLVPAQPRTAEEQAKIDAAGWFMTGQIREKREDFVGALEAYRKAVTIAPEAVQIYRSLIPLAFSLNQADEAVKYALKAVELDPNDYELIRRLAVHMAANSQVTEAVQLFEKAAASESLSKTSEPYVILSRDMALLYRATGQKDKAADAYEVVFDALIDPQKYELSSQTRRALRKDENSSFERIGQAFLDANRPEKAIAAFEKAGEKGQGLPGTLGYNLAQVHLQTEQPAKALDELQKYFDAQLQSKGRDAYELLANILKALGKSDELISRLEGLATKDSKNSTLQYFLAAQYAEAGRLEEAEAKYQETLRGSGDPQGYAGLASVYRRQQRPAELLKTLAKAVAKADNSEVIETELEAIAADEKMVDALIEVGHEAVNAKPSKLDYPGSVILGQLAVEAKRTEPALTFYRHAIKERPDRAATLYELLGQYLFDVEEYKLAAEIYRGAIEDRAAAGAKVQWQFRLSQAAELIGETDEALDVIRQAQQQLPEVGLLRYQEGWIYYHSGQLDDSIRVFEKVIEKFPQDKDIIRRAQFTLSAVYVQKGEDRKGEEILERILEKDPDDPSVNNDLGYLYADHGKNLEKAESMIRKAVAAEPENAAYLDSLGWVLFKRGKYEEAIPPLEKATEKERGGDATIWNHLGDAYDRVGKTEQAVAAWQKALKKAKESRVTDKELIPRIEEKLNKAGEGVGTLQPAGNGTP